MYSLATINNRVHGSAISKGGIARATMAPLTSKPHLAKDSPDSAPGSDVGRGDTCRLPSAGRAGSPPAYGAAAEAVGSTIFPASWESVLWLSAG